MGKISFEKKTPSAIEFNGRTHFVRCWQDLVHEMVEDLISFNDAASGRLLDKEIGSTGKKVCLSDPGTQPFVRLSDGSFFPSYYPDTEYAFLCRQLCLMFEITPCDMTISMQEMENKIRQQQEKPSDEDKPAESVKDPADEDLRFDDQKAIDLVENSDTVVIYYVNPEDGESTENQIAYCLDDYFVGFCTLLFQLRPEKMKEIAAQKYISVNGKKTLLFSENSKQLKLPEPIVRNLWIETFFKPDTMLEYSRTLCSLLNISLSDFHVRKTEADDFEEVPPDWNDGAFSEPNRYVQPLPENRLKMTNYFLQSGSKAGKLNPFALRKPDISVSAADHDENMRIGGIANTSYEELEEFQRKRITLQVEKSINPFVISDVSSWTGIYELIFSYFRKVMPKIMAELPSEAKFENQPIWSFSKIPYADTELIHGVNVNCSLSDYSYIYGIKQLIDLQNRNIGEFNTSNLVGTVKEIYFTYTVADQSQSPEQIMEKAWDDLIEKYDSLPSLQKVLSDLHKAKIPIPGTDFILLDSNGIIIAEAALVWKTQHSVFLVPPQNLYQDIFVKQGWTVFESQTAVIKSFPEESAGLG